MVLQASMFLSLGAILSIIALIIDQLQGLIVVGVAFILIGIIKATISYTQTSKTRHTHNTQPQQTQQPTKQKRCFVCSAKNSAQANFCGHCGHKLS